MLAGRSFVGPPPHPFQAVAPFYFVAPIVDLPLQDFNLRSNRPTIGLLQAHDGQLILAYQGE